MYIACIHNIACNSYMHACIIYIYIAIYMHAFYIYMQYIHAYVCPCTCCYETKFHNEYILFCEKLTTLKRRMMMYSRERINDKFCSNTEIQRLVHACYKLLLFIRRGDGLREKGMQD